MGEFSPWHLLIIALIFVVLFGARKLPDAARAIGQSLRIFKAETKGLREDSSAPVHTTVTRPLPPAPTVPVEGSTVVTDRPEQS